MSKAKTNQKNTIPKTKNQIIYEKKCKRTNLLIQISRILILGIFLVIWEIAASKNYINVFFFSSPSRIWNCFLTSIQGRNLLHHIGISIYETLASFIIIMITSLFVASLLWRYKLISKILEPVFVTLNSLPKSALAPLIIVWLGTGTKTIIIAGISVAIFGCIINLYTCFLNADPDKQTLIQTMGGSKLDIFVHVIFPSSFGQIFSNMKVNIGLALVGVMIGEFLAAKEGLGYLIIYSSQIFQLDMLILCILILCIIAILLYESIYILEKRWNK